MSAFRPLELEKLTFTSIPDEVFRVRLSQDQQFTSVLLENRATHKQWSLEMADVNSYSPSGVMLPPAMIIDMLKEAFQLSCRKESTEPNREAPVVDAEVNGSGIVLVLKCHVYGNPLPAFKFPLNAVEADPVKVLESQLQDSREETAELRREVTAWKEEVAALKGEVAVLKGEMQRLKEQRKKGFFSLSSSGTLAQNSVISWNYNNPRELSDFVTLSADNNTVTIVQPGVYQIHFRFTVNHNGNGAPVCQLRVNGSYVAYVLANPQGNHETVEATEILRLKQGDRLDVLYSGNNTSGSYCPASRFAGIFLSD